MSRLMELSGVCFGYMEVLATVGTAATVIGAYFGYRQVRPIIRKKRKKRLDIQIKVDGGPVSLSSPQESAKKSLGRFKNSMEEIFEIANKYRSHHVKTECDQNNMCEE